MPHETRSPFEDTLVKVENTFDFKLSPKIGADLVYNIRTLRDWRDMSKPQLEAVISRVAIISLNDQEYERLQEKIRKLLEDNENAASEQGIDVD